MTRLILKLESVVSVLVEWSAFWVSGAMKLVWSSDCTADGEWVNSALGSVWSEKEAEDGSRSVTDVREEQGQSVREAAEAARWEKRVKEQSGSDLSKTEWPVLSKTVGSK